MKIMSFVGRQDEMGKIQEILQAWETRKALFITGDGGVGKSHLLQEAKARLQRTLSRPPTPSGDKTEVTRIGLLVGINNSHWVSLFRDGCGEMSRRLGVELKEIYEQINLNDLTKGFDQLLAHNIQTIIVAGGSGAKLRVAIEKAVFRGTKVILVANDFSCEGAIRIQQDEQGLAHRSLEQLFRDVEEGEIAICGNEQIGPFQERKKLLSNFLETYPNVRVVTEIGRTTPVDAKGYLEIGSEENEIAQEIEKALADHPNLRAIWAMNVAYGDTVERFLEKNGRLDIGIYSMEYDERVLTAMRKPNSCWRSTSAANPLKVGRIAIRLAVQVASGQTVPQHYNVPITTLTQQDDAKGIYPTEFLRWENIPGWNETVIGLDLQKLAARYRRYWDVLYFDDEGRNWLLMDLLDLDDLGLQAVQDIQWTMMQRLGEENFKAYLNSLETLIQYEQEFSSQVSHQRRLTDDRFLECMATATRSCRVVIFCDTIDTLNEEQAQAVIDFLLHVSEHLDNVALFISGRNATKFQQDFQKKHILVEKDLLALQPLDDTARAEYFDQCLKLALGRVDTTTREKILFLSNGVPILLDLAVDWLAYGLELDWLRELDLTRAKTTSSEDDLKRLNMLFEKSLVQGVTQVRRTTDRLILALGRIYPMDIPLCAELLGLPEEQTRAQFEQAKRFSFVKVLPDGKIKLHDTMRDMVLRYVWPQMEFGRKTRDSQRAAQFFGRQHQRLMQEIAQLKNAITPGDERSTTVHTLERQIWQVRVQLLEHQMVVDANRGIDYFCEFFDTASKSNQLYQRGLLLEKASKHLEDIADDEKRYELQKRQIRHWIDSGNLPEAHQLTQEILDQETLSPNQRVDMLTKLADCDHKMGNLAQAAREFEIALDTGLEDPSSKPALGKLMSNVGRMKNLMGQWDDAAQIYEDALALENNDPDQTAELLTNLASVYSEKGDYDAADVYCNQAIRIRQESNHRRGLGTAFSTLASICRNKGEYQQAIDHINEALAIFQPEGDINWTARLYVQRGIAYRLLGNQGQALEDLRRSQASNVRLYQPYTYHIIGCIYWDQGEFPQASQYFEQSDRQATETGDVRCQINNLLTISEMEYQRWIDAGKHNLVFLTGIQRKNIQFERLLGQAYGYPHHRGRMQLLMANVAFEQGHYEEALALYKKAFINLSLRVAGYGKFTFADHQKTLSANLFRLAKENRTMALNACNTLKDAWIKAQPPIPRLPELKMLCDIARREIARIPHE